MNERIADLLEQAFAECKTFEDGTTIRTSEALARFAELIIKDCVDVAAKYDEPKMSGPGLMIGSMISEHFGVE